MKNRTKSLPARLCELLIAALPLIAVPSAQSSDSAVQALFGRSSSAPSAGVLLGGVSRAMASSSKWIVIGAPFSADRGVSWEGAVHVFNAGTRAWVRRILPPSGTNVSLRFGSSIAVSGDLALIGAFGGESQRGRAFVYNLATGALVRTLVAADGAAGDQFGFDVAIQGDRLIVSADGESAARGAVYIFQLSTGAQLAKIDLGLRLPNDRFGIAIAADGGILAVGAQGYNSNRGAVLFYDLNTFALIKLYQPAGLFAGTYCGKTLAMSEGRVLIGGFGKAWLHDLRTDLGVSLTPPAAPVPTVYFGDTVTISGPLMAVGDTAISGERGVVHFYSSADGSYIESIVAPNGDPAAQNFGKCIVLRDLSFIATAPLKRMTDSGTTQGAAYHFNLAPQEMPFTQVVARGGFAPGLFNTSYATTGEAFVGPSGKTAFTTTLSAIGSTKVSGSAVSSDIDVLDRHALTAQSGISLSPGPLISSMVNTKAVNRIAMNDSSYLIGSSTLAGNGVNASNHLILWSRKEGGISYYLRTGSRSVILGGILHSLPEWVMSNAEGGHFATIFTLRPDSETAVSALDDSGLYSAVFSSLAGIDYEAMRENSTAPVSLPAGTRYGQFAPRLANYSSIQSFSTALTGPAITTATNAAIFSRARTQLATVVAQKGSEVRDATGAAITGALYNTFIGESNDHLDNIVYRATIRGAAPDLRSSNNEGVWVRYGASSDHLLSFRKGMTVTSSTSVRVAKIINFWAAGNDALTPKVLGLLQLSGTGVSSANDQALMTHTVTTTPVMLMREGDVAPGCEGARIRVINRVEFDAESGSYAVLASLSGAPKGTDLALFTGNVHRGNFGAQAALRRPHLALRKGQLWDNQPSRIKSILLPKSSTTASGAGGTGRGRAISRNGDFVITVEFENGFRQVMKGSAL